MSRFKKIINLKKNNLRIITVFLTGHCRLNEHLFRIGLATDDQCRMCLEGEEYPEHILEYCPALSSVRKRYLGQESIAKSQMSKLDPDKILTFLKAIELDIVL